MIRVFIGGSRRIGKMNGEIARRLDNIVEKGHRVVIGDAKGFDRIVQDYLSESRYRNVLVYCTAGACRNNIGNWPIHAVEYLGKDRGREFYTAKDDAMLAEADFGFFAWDGKSKGTLRNIVKMAERRRPCSVYFAPNQLFLTVRSAADARMLAGGEIMNSAPTFDLLAQSQTQRATASIDEGTSAATITACDSANNSLEADRVQGSLFATELTDDNGSVEKRSPRAGRGKPRKAKAPSSSGKQSSRKRKAG